MASGRDLLLGPGGLAGFTVHTDRRPNAGTCRLMDWLGVKVEVDVSATIDRGGVSCLIGGCEWRWDGLGDRAAAIEEHRADEHAHIPAFKFSVRTDAGRAALEAMDDLLADDGRLLDGALPLERTDDRAAVDRAVGAEVVDRVLAGGRVRGGAGFVEADAVDVLRQELEHGVLPRRRAPDRLLAAEKVELLHHGDDVLEMLLDGMAEIIPSVAPPSDSEVIE